jgi:hypothetical protein
MYDGVRWNGSIALQFLASTLERVKLSALRSGHFNAGESVHSIHWTEGCVDTLTETGRTEEEMHLFPLPAIRRGFLGCHTLSLITVSTELHGLHRNRNNVLQISESDIQCFQNTCEGIIGFMSGLLVHFNLSFIINQRRLKNIYLPDNILSTKSEVSFED